MNQTSTAYTRLRDDILSGVRSPGERLKITELAEALEVSPGAVREALSRLVPENLVVSRDQKGFLVAPLSIDDLEELTDLRCELEAFALRRAVALGDDHWEAGIVAAAHRLSRSPRRSEDSRTLSQDWIKVHADFHMALIRGCGSQRLIDLQTQLFEQSERYRGLSSHNEVDRDVAGEHQSLVDAALDRDADLLIERIVTHLRRTTALITASVNRQALAAAEDGPAGATPDDRRRYGAFAK